RWHPLRPRRQFRARTEYPEIPLPDEGRLAPGVPARREPAAVGLYPFPGGLVRRVTRSGAEIEEIWLLRGGRPDIGDELHRLVDQVAGEVIALGDHVRIAEDVVVAVQGRRELVVLAAHETVEPLEAASQRPAPSGCPGVAFLFGGEVPF